MWTGLAAKRKKLEDDKKDIPEHMKEPTLDKLLKLRQETPDAYDTPEEKSKCNHAFTFLVEHIMPQVIGKQGWKEEMCSKVLSDTDITALDEAFTLLCCLNMWNKWHSDSNTMT